MRIGKRRKMGAPGSFWFGLIFALFSFCFFVVGLLSVTKALGYLAWEKTPCVIEGFRIRADTKQDPTFQADLRFRYTSKGQEYTSDRLWPDKKGSDDSEDLEAVFDRLRNECGREDLTGASTFCRVNPHDAGDATLLSASASAWGESVFCVIGGLFMLVGISIMRMGNGASSATNSGDLTSPGGKGWMLGIGFCGVFACGGVLMICQSVIPTVSRKVKSGSWTETPARIVWSRIKEHGSGEDRSVKLDVCYHYTFNGREYRSNQYGLGESLGSESLKRDIVRANAPGSAVVCRVNPAKPWQAIVDRELHGAVAMFLFPIPFILVGVGGLVGMWWWPRHQRKLEQEKASVVPPRPGKSSGERVLLTGEFDSATSLFGLGFAAIFWNSIVGAFVSTAVSEWMGGHPSTFLNLFLIPFVAIGLFLLGVVLNRLIQYRRPLYDVWLQPAPLAPDQEASITWQRRSGKGHPERLSIELIAVKVMDPGEKQQQKVIHKQSLADLPRPGDASFQDLRFKIPLIPAGREGPLIWKIRMAPRMVSWLPAIPDDMVIPFG
ncbi:MAG: DUF3592 domain-containing protein [Luteolibacter sp.]